MNTVVDIYNSYLASEADCRRIAERICEKENSIARLQKQIKKLEKKQYGVSWVNGIVIPLAEMLMPLLECESYEIFGPFGLRAETSIHFKKPNSTAQYCDYRLALTLRTEYNDDFNYKGNYCSPSTKSVRLFYNTGKRTHIYPQGSIGELNGFDFIEKPLPDDTDEIIAIIKEVKE